MGCAAMSSWEQAWGQDRCEVSAPGQRQHAYACADGLPRGADPPGQRHSPAQPALTLTLMSKRSRVAMPTALLGSGSMTHRPLISCGSRQGRRKPEVSDMHLRLASSSTLQSASSRVVSHMPAHAAAAPLALKSPSIMEKRASRRPSGSRASSTSITASASRRHSTPWLQPRCRIHV